MSARPVFPLRLEKTYYEKGFFNVKREFDHNVGEEGPVTLSLRGGYTMEARVDRRAQQNGTARIMGGAVLRDWFQKMYSEGDIVPVRFDTPHRFYLG